MMNSTRSLICSAPRAPLATSGRFEPMPLASTRSGSTPQAHQPGADLVGALLRQRLVAAAARVDVDGHAHPLDPAIGAQGGADLRQRLGRVLRQLGRGALEGHRLEDLDASPGSTMISESPLSGQPSSSALPLIVSGSIAH
jgi:hypothetical protein